MMSTIATSQPYGVFAGPAHRLAAIGATFKGRTASTVGFRVPAGVVLGATPDLRGISMS